MNKFICLMALLMFLLGTFSVAGAQNLPGGIPQINIPPISIPTVSIPTVNIPQINIPTVNIPTVNIPDIQVPVPAQPVFPTPPPFNPFPDIPFGGKPVQTLDYRIFDQEATWTPAPREGKERYDEAMAFFNEGKFYSAWEAFSESKYGDWEEWAAKCPQDPPATGETWHDSTQWMQDMQLTISVEQSASTDMFFRVYKNDSLISNIYISGPNEVTVLLPGNANYMIKDGIGRTWYGEKEAFGRDGTYETMTFDLGAERVYLESGYAYTLSINVTDAAGSDVDSRPENWDNFAED